MRNLSRVLGKFHKVTIEVTNGTDLKVTTTNGGSTNISVDNLGYWDDFEKMLDVHMQAHSMMDSGELVGRIKADKGDGE